ncbi:MAG: proline--tRNA ligase [Candidatus Levyibacteriota bacterium]
MRYSKLFGKTTKDAPKDEPSVNARLLTQGGFIRKEVAGVYNFLPLGLRVVNKISNIVREEMNKVGGQEILLSALQNKESWQKSGRWNSFDALFKLASQFEKEYALGPTHEEVLVPLAQEFILSYKDLPVYLYQIQTKFRDEARAKAGILRGREFLMKDFYSFHETEEDMNDYYEKMKTAYKAIFGRLGLDAIETKASGGTFSDFSHEYQVITEAGEDEIIYCPCGDFSENSEIAKVAEGKQCDLGHGPLKKVKTIEAGNIFPLSDKFSKAFGLKFKNKNGEEKYVMMGCYGLGITRVMGAIVEVSHDDKGIIWPKEVSPYQAHLVHIEDPGTEPWAKEVYEKLTEAGVEVLWDERENASAGQKFADADLIGIPVRLVVSAKLGKGKIEAKHRREKESKVMGIDDVLAYFCEDCC